MTIGIHIRELEPDDWQVLRSLRIDSLSESPDAFGGNLETEELLSESEWRKKFENFTHLVASIAGTGQNQNERDDVGVLSVELLEGDFGATCWVGSCWVKPEARGKGVMRALISYLDDHADERGWKVQGLGVFADNFDAIATYQRLGFVAMGDLQPSTRRPGRYFQRMIRNPKRAEVAD